MTAVGLVQHPWRYSDYSDDGSNKSKYECMGM